MLSRLRNAGRSALQGLRNAAGRLFNRGGGQPPAVPPGRAAPRAARTSGSA